MAHYMLDTKIYTQTSNRTEIGEIKRSNTAIHDEDVQFGQQGQQSGLSKPIH
jgi:hypothetical protein